MEPSIAKAWLIEGLTHKVRFHGEKADPERSFGARRYIYDLTWLTHNLESARLNHEEIVNLAKSCISDEIN